MSRGLTALLIMTFMFASSSMKLSLPALPAIAVSIVPFVGALTLRLKPPLERSETARSTSEPS
jgi:hypothetical protein